MVLLFPWQLCINHTLAFPQLLINRNTGHRSPPHLPYFAPAAADVCILQSTRDTDQVPFLTDVSYRKFDNFLAEEVLHSCCPFCFFVVACPYCRSPLGALKVIVSKEGNTKDNLGKLHSTKCKRRQGFS